MARCMQLLIEFLPILVFAGVYVVTKNVYAATVALMVAMAVQIGYQWVRHRKVNKMLLASGALVAVFGGITLAVHNPLFIQWKPTVLNWAFAIVFLGSQVVGEKTLIERIMGHAVELDKASWRQLNLMWVLNFFILGCANLYVVYNFSEEIWVYFKLFGMIGFTLLMAIGQAVWISKRMSQHEAGKEPGPHGR